MGGIIIKCSTCFRSPLNSDTGFLLSEAAKARTYLEELRARLDADGLKGVEVVFSRAEGEAKGRYATSDDDDDSMLLDPLLCIRSLTLAKESNAAICGIISASQFPDSILHDNSISLYLYDNLFGILEWDFALRHAELVIAPEKRSSIEQLLHDISLAMMKAVNETGIFAKVHDAATTIALKADNGRKPDFFRLEREQDYVNLLVRKKETRVTKRLPVITPNVLWTARLYIWSQVNSEEEKNRLLAALLHSDLVRIAVGGSEIYCAWGSSAIASHTRVDDGILDSVARIRRELQYIFSMTNEYAKKTGKIYFRFLDGFQDEAESAADWLESARTHLHQILYICKDRDMGLQGWKSECFATYMRLWKVEPYIATTISKVDTAGTLVETLRIKQSHRMQRQIKNILAAFGLMEALGVITELTEYSHSTDYRSKGSLGILRILHEWRPDTTITVAAVFLTVFLIIAILYADNLKE